MEGSTLPTGHQKKLLRAVDSELGLENGVSTGEGRGIPGGKKSRILSSGAWVGHHGDLEDCESCRGSMGRPQGWALAF